MRSRTFWLIAAVIALLAYVAGQWAAAYVTASPDPGNRPPHDEQQIAGSADSIVQHFGLHKRFLNQSTLGRLDSSSARCVRLGIRAAAAAHQADANQPTCC